MNSKLFTKTLKFIKSIFPPKVYALVGRSGTGKSFRAQFVAKQNHIHLIIDDGLLIKNDRILAGKSAKQETNFLTAVKRALFRDEEHCKEILNALNNEIFFKVLIIGTSEQMVQRITKILNLPQPKNIIHIEDIATQDEIENAMRIRYSEGKHVIPVSPQQITRTYPHIAYDSIRVLQKGFGFTKSISEKTIVKPEFSKLEEKSLSQSAIAQMINQSLDQYSETIKLISITQFAKDEKGYNLEIELRSPISVNADQIDEIETYLSEALEKYGNILIHKIKVVVSVWQ